MGGHLAGVEGGGVLVRPGHLKKRFFSGKRRNKNLRSLKVSNRDILENLSQECEIRFLSFLNSLDNGNPNSKNNTDKFDMMSKFNDDIND